MGVGRTGAVETDASLAAVGVPDGRLVGVELALLVATMLAGGGKHWRGRLCDSKWRSGSTTGRGGDVFDKRSGLSHQLVHLPVSTLFGCEDKHACVNEGRDHITSTELGERVV